MLPIVDLAQPLRSHCSPLPWEVQSWVLPSADLQVRLAPIGAALGLASLSPPVSLAEYGRATDRRLANMYEYYTI
eukprot:2713524-Pyramimonas_sp.AAC.1